MNRERDERRWRRVADVLLEEAQHMSTPRSRAEKLLEVGQIWEVQLRDASHASGFYAEAAELGSELTPQAIDALVSLAQRSSTATVNRIALDVLENTGRLDELVRMLQSIADRETDPAGALALYLRAGHLAAESLGDRQTSRTCLVSAHRVANEPGDSRVLEQATRHLKIWPSDERIAALRAMLLVESDRGQEAVETLITGSIHAAEASVKAKLRLRAASLAADVTAQPNDAVSYLRDALALDPSVAGAARDILDSLRESWPLTNDLGTLLIDVLDTLGDFRESQAVYERSVELADISRKGAMLLAQATHAEENLGEPATAFELYRQAAIVSVDEVDLCIAGMRRAAWEGVDGAFEVLSDFLRQVQRWDDLVELLDGQAMLSADDIERAATTFAIGEVLESNVGQLDGALSHYLQAFRLNPSEAKYVAAAERIYRQQEQWDLVDNLLERRIELAEDADARMALRIEQGVVRHRHLRDYLSAYDLLRDALRTAGGTSSSTVYPALADLVLDVWAFPVIEEGLRGRIAGADSKRRAARLTQELSFLFLEFLNETDRGLQLLKDAADLCPADPTVFERVTQQYERHADDLVLARWLEDVEGRPLDPTFKADILEQASELYQKLDADWLICRRVWEARLRLQPNDVKLVNSVLELARKEGDEGLVATVLSEALDASDTLGRVSEVTRLSWMRQLAESHRAQGDVGAEIRHHQAILAQWPLDRDAFEALSRCFVEQEEWRSLADLLRDIVRVREQGEGELDVAGRTEWARIIGEKLSDNEGTIAVLEPLVEQEALDAVSADLLMAAYGQMQNVTGQFSVLEVQLMGADSNREVEIIRQMEAFAEEYPDLSELGEAILHHKVNRDPTAMAPRLELIALYREAEDGERLLYELDAAWRMDPSDERLHLLRERATLLAENSDSVADAVMAWEELLERVPDDKEALTGLLFLYGQQQRHDDVRRIIGELLALTQEPDERLTLLREEAILTELRFGDLDAAFASWCAAHELLPNDPEVLEELIRLAEERADSANLVKYGHIWLEKGEAVDDVELLRRIAQAADEQKLADVAQQFWEHLLSLEPTDGEALQRVVAVVHAAGNSVRAIELFERLATSDVSLGQRREARGYHARLLVEAERFEEAITAFRHLAELDSRQTDALIQIHELAVQLERHPEAVEALVEAINREESAQERTELSRRVARMFSGPLDNAAAAVPYWESILGFDHTDVEALSSLWPEYARDGRKLDMLRTLDSLVRGSTNIGTAGDYMVSAARLVESEREDPALSFECWWRAHRLAGGDIEGSLENLGRLADGADRWADYAQALVLAAEAQEDSLAGGRYFSEAVDIAEHRLNDQVTAFEYARRGLLFEPDDAFMLEALRRTSRAVSLASTWGEAADTLKFVAENCSESRADLYVESARASLRSHDRQEDAFELLCTAMRISGGTDGRSELFELAEALGRADSLAELIRGCVESADEKDRGSLLSSVAREYEERPEGAERSLELYLQAMQLEPDEESHRNDVWRLAESLDAWPIVARFFEQLVDLSTDPADRFQFLRNKAQIEKEWLDEVERAFGTMKRAIATMPLDQDARLTLESWATSDVQRADIATFYESEGGWAELDGARRTLLRAAVDLYRLVGDNDAATRVLEKVSDIAPDDDEVIDERLELLEQSGDYQALGKVLSRQSERARGARRLHLLRRLGRLFDGKIGTQAKADAAWGQVLEAEPLDDEAFRALGRSLRAAEDWTALESMIARRTPHLSPELQLDELRIRADLLNGPIGRPDRAFELLCELAERLEDASELLPELESLVTDAAQAKVLLRLSDAALAATDIPDPAILRLVGRLALDWLNRPQKALDALQAAFSLEPDDVTLARTVGALLTTQRKHGELLDLYRQCGDAFFEDEDGVSRAVKWHMAVAELQEEKLLDFTGAVETHEKLLAIEPDYRPALNRLQGLLTRLRDVPGLVATLNRLAAMTEQPRKVMILVEGARAIKGMGQMEASVPLWREVLAHAPGHEEAQEIVERFGRRQRDWDAVVEVHEARVRSARTPDRKAEMLCELAAFQREQLADTQSALDALTQAHEAAPGHVRAMVDLAEVVLDSDDAQQHSWIGDVLVARANQNMAEKEASLLLPVMAKVQVQRARYCVEADDSEGALAILRTGYRRAPNERALAQLFADRLYEAGAIVDAGHIYDHTVMPTFVPGSEGDSLRAQEHLRRATALTTIGLDVQAIHHYEAAARFPQTRVPALDALANIQEKAGRWEAAARYREKFADVVEDPAIGAISLVAAGKILHEQLGRFHRAVNLYRRAVKMGVNEPVMLLTVLEALHEAGRVDEALIVVGRLLEVDLSPQSKARLHARRADLLKKDGRPDEAMDALVEALVADPSETDRLDALFAIIDGIDEEQREQAREKLERAIEVSEGQVQEALRLRLASWLESAGDLEQALAQYNSLRASGASAFDVLDGRARLSRGLAESTSDPEYLASAFESRFASLQAQPGTPGALEDLAELFRLSGKGADADFPLGILGLFGLGNARTADAFRVPVFDSPLLEVPATPGVAAISELVAQVFVECGGAVNQLFHTARVDEFGDVELYEEPVEIVGRVCTALGLDEVEVLLVRGAAIDLEVINLAPVQLLVGEDVVNRSTPEELAFRAARLVHLTRSGNAFVTCLSPAECRALIGAVAALSDEEGGPEYALSLGADEDRIAFWAGLIMEECSPETIMAWRELAAYLPEHGSHAIDDWSRWVLSSANRVGLFAAGDLAAAAKCLKAESPEGRAIAVSGPTAFRTLLEAVPAIAALHAYAFSPDFWRLRWSVEDWV